MARQILDTPFHEQISDALTKGEIILWSEKPRRKNWFSFFDIVVIIFSIVLIIFRDSFSAIPFFPFVVGGGFFTLLMSSKIREFVEVKNTFYAITQKRIFFEIKNNLQKVIFSIPLSDIEKITKNGETLLIKTKNITSPFLENPNTQKHQDLQPLPRIENVRDIDEVITILQNNIQQQKLLI